jgi:hypothetical protein
LNPAKNAVVMFVLQGGLTQFAQPATAKFIQEKPNAETAATANVQKKFAVTAIR